VGAFKCNQCGACEESLLATAADGNVFGLYLEPHEIDRFPREVVFPLSGYGDPIVITAYQLGVNNCPHYDKSGGVGRCRIYERRPLTCAAFPILARNKVSAVCPSVRKLTDGVDVASVRPELAAHQSKLDAKLARPPDEWVWPLNKKCWIPLPKA
jgi:Fe-S-cluster containining protein